MPSRKRIPVPRPTSPNENDISLHKETGFPADSLIKALQSQKIGLAVFDEALRFVALNDHCAKIHNLSVADHLGKSARQILGSLSDKYEPLLRSVFATGIPLVNVEVCGLLPKRSEDSRWIDNFFPVKNTNEKVTHVAIFIVEVPPSAKNQVVRDRHGEPMRPTDGANMSSRGAIEGPTPNLGVSLRYSRGRVSRKLSFREGEVLQFLALGKSNKEIGCKLNISVKTVETYRTRLMLKLEAPSLVYLVHYAIKNELVELQV